MASTIQYNMEKIREIIDECNWSLSEKVQSIFQELDKLIVVEDEDLNAVPLKRNDRSFDRFKNKKRFYKSSSKSGSLNNMNIEDWEAIRNFKPTEKEEVSDFNKNVNEIRSHINKLSKTNYDVQKRKIIEKMMELFNEDESSENKEKIVNIIFDICSSNKFLSEIYADLYVELIGYNDLFGDILDNYIINFKDTLNNIQYIDPDENYDGFCDYNKINEIRKSNSVFLINLMKRDMIEKTSIIELIIEMLDTCLLFIKQENRLHEVEEITENIFLLVEHSKLVLQDQDLWKSKIDEQIKHFSKLKAKDYPSLSSRCVFKFMDM